MRPAASLGNGLGRGGSSGRTGPGVHGGARTAARTSARPPGVNGSKRTQRRSLGAIDSTSVVRSYVGAAGIGSAVTAAWGLRRLGEVTQLRFSTPAAGPRQESAHPSPASAEPAAALGQRCYYQNSVHAKRFWQGRGSGVRASPPRCRSTSPGPGQGRSGRTTTARVRAHGVRLTSWGSAGAAPRCCPHPSCTPWTLERVCSDREARRGPDYYQPGRHPAG